MALANLESRQSSKRNLIQQFDPLSAPNACPFLLLHWANSGRNSDTRDTTPHRPDCAEDRLVNTLFNLDWEWVIRPRTEQEIRTLITSTCTCSPQARRTPEHVDGVLQQERLHGKPPVWCIVGSCLFPMLEVDLEDIQPLHEIHLRQRWPRSHRTFLPRGPLLALQGILQWLKYTLTTQEILPLLSGLDHFVQIARSAIVPHLVLFRDFKDGITFMLNHSMKVLAVVKDTYPMEPKHEDEMVRQSHPYASVWCGSWPSCSIVSSALHQLVRKHGWSMASGCAWVAEKFDTVHDGARRRHGNTNRPHIEMCAPSWGASGA